MKITIAELKKIIEQEIDGLFDDPQETLSEEEEQDIAADVNAAEDAASKLADDLLRDIQAEGAKIATRTRAQPNFVMGLVIQNLTTKSEDAG